MHDLSIAVAVYNEEESLPHLCAKLHDVLSKLGKSYVDSLPEYREMQTTVARLEPIAAAAVNRVSSGGR